jgi:hypothetical protein
VVRIERVTKHIAASAQIVLARLLSARFGVMAAQAQRSERVESRERAAAAPDRGAVIDRHRGFNSAKLETGLAKRLLLEFQPP